MDVLPFKGFVHESVEGVLDDRDVLEPAEEGRDSVLF